MNRLDAVRWTSAALWLVLVSGWADALSVDDIARRYGIDPVQIPEWSSDDLEFHLHGSMAVEVLPERLLVAFRTAYPDLYPGSDPYTSFGLTLDSAAGYPVGLSRREVPHLGGLPSYGINCASCHLGEFRISPDATPVRVLGGVGRFDVQAFYGAFLVAMARTANPVAMEAFLPHYLAAVDPAAPPQAREALAAAIEREREAIANAVTSDPWGANETAPGGVYDLSPEDLELDRTRLLSGAQVASVVRELLRLFHRIRAALRLPDGPPAAPPHPAGPGRNDAFGVLAAGNLGLSLPYAPSKYGLMWNLWQRKWVHWDGNTGRPVDRNVLAVLVLGAPREGKRVFADWAILERQTNLTERILPPRYPWKVDGESAGRGESLYAAHCASCHDLSPADEDRRLHGPDEIGTDPARARQFDDEQARRYPEFLRSIELEGYDPPGAGTFRATGKYMAADMAGVWARSPYLHNGSIRTLAELLLSSGERPKSFRRGSDVYDPEALGHVDDGPFRFDPTLPGNGNGGHEYGTHLSEPEKRDLVEYLKTR